MTSMVAAGWSTQATVDAEGGEIETQKATKPVSVM